MKPICIIAGAMEPEWVPVPRAGDLLVAADRGLARLNRLGLAPHLVVGDFD